MHKVLQALVDTFLLAAGSVELGSTAYSPTDHLRDMGRQAAAKPLRARSGKRAGRSDPQPLIGEPAFRAKAKKSQL